ncbi:3-oxoacyl-ACP reductase FabG [Larsenimonas rhizosphaerae]|uniref:3-oxoacyl-ACP reductase FabG n=1 Tax=Larsenimonas rhizosphaerae TaxID=2944682 RepID=A0AA42CVG3_9GAMM|nr:3-oxoacyl-ACP reductase FabG [Larsenimonas rhizosphaerae]MCX2524946.1 3-oxoacyl-ACP reductase FabG [Larsenimonas rhizosphaerae]
MTSSENTHRILVTGANRGIGRAIALRLAKDGFDIVVHYRQRQDDAAMVCECIEALGRKAWLLQADISDRDATRIALEQEVEARGPFYGVVLNAGFSQDAPFPGMQDEQWDSVLSVNLDGFYNVLRPLVMPMIQARKGGRIVTLSSAAGVVGQRGQVNYSAAKSGLIGASRALALELAKRRITVNCIAPGWIDTEMTEAVPREQIKEQVPMQRMGEPDEIAGVVSFLCSRDAAYMTRQVLSVNGGMF